MKIKNLLMTAAFLTMSGGAMAQTTITAGNAKFVAAKEAGLTYYYKNTKAMGGFQMVVSLPEGVTLVEDEEKTELNINGSKASADFFNVTVPSGFECIGVKADVDGTTSDGTAYKAGDVLLVCFPVKAGTKYKATSKASFLCTLRLKTSGTSVKPLKKVAVQGFVGSDTNGTGAETTAQYVASADSKLSPTKVLKEGDANNDSGVDVGDIDYVIEAIGGDYVTYEDADVNADSDIDVGDIDFIIERI
ncbi:MAG: hypothetical protein J5658_12175 [Prevotella sp.]|nr:hypothetical protein [Prevotella sp.]